MPGYGQIVSPRSLARSSAAALTDHQRSAAVYSGERADGLVGCEAEPSLSGNTFSRFPASRTCAGVSARGQDILSYGDNRMSWVLAHVKAQRNAQTPCKYQVEQLVGCAAAACRQRVPNISRYGRPGPMRQEVGLQGVERVLAGLHAGCLRGKQSSGLARNAQAWCIRPRAGAKRGAPVPPVGARPSAVRTLVREPCEGNGAGGGGTFARLRSGTVGGPHCRSAQDRHSANVKSRS